MKEELNNSTNKDDDAVGITAVAAVVAADDETEARALTTTTTTSSSSVLVTTTTTPKTLNEATTNNNNNNKYDEKYFNDWLETLRHKLECQLPKSKSSMPYQDIFQQLCADVETTVDALSKSKKVLEALQKQKNPPTDDVIIKRAIETVKACEKSAASAKTSLQKMTAVIVSELEKTVLSVNFNDADLITYSCIRHATPKKLAAWCAEEIDDDNDGAVAQLIELFRNPHALREFCEWGHPKDGEYGRAVQIHSQILLLESSSSENNDDSGNDTDTDTDLIRIKKKLALAVALEMCSTKNPYERHPLNKYEEPINPVLRYQHYYNAYINDELDSAFENFTAFELRHVVNSDAPNEILQWGRTCLQNYRPDLITMSNQQWRYLQVIHSDVGYKTTKWWLPYMTYPQILSQGGKCGARAWLGRFICKSFGMPTWGVKQPGHAALSRWTPKGWVTCLGAGFNFSYWDDQCGNDFLLETQARSAVENNTNNNETPITASASASATDEEEEEFPYLRQVLRLEMLAKYYGENNHSIRKHCMIDSTQPWYALSLMQRTLLAGKGFVAAAAAAAADNNNSASLAQLPPSDVAIENKVDEHLFEEGLEEEEGEEGDNDTSTSNSAGVEVGATTILIPATGYSHRSSKKVVVAMKSVLGGEQLFVGMSGEVEYTLNSPDYNDMMKTKKTYKLSCYVCTVHHDEKPMLLTVTTDDASMVASTTATTGEQRMTSTVTYQVPIPYTAMNGISEMWAETEPIEVELGGPDITSTKLSFKRQSGFHGGVAMKYIKLELDEQQQQQQALTDDEDWVIVNHSSTI